MNTLDDLNKNDEIIEIKLPRAEAEILRTMIKEREIYYMFVNKLKSAWIFVVAAGILTLLALGDRIFILFNGTVK